MSTIIKTLGEAGGGVAAHLQCPHCGHFSKSHAHQLSHMAAAHPTCLGGVLVGRLGNILMYQSTARLFHCSDCFYTSRDFTKLYKHIISKHCEDEREGGSGGGGEEKEEGAGQGAEQEGGEESDQTKKQKSKVTMEAEEEETKSGKEGGEGDESVLMFDGAGYHCLICGFKTRPKAFAVNHVVRKHDIPKAYATQAVKWNDAIGTNATPKPLQQSGASGRGGAEEEEVAMVGAGLCGDMMKEEMEATAKVVRFIHNRYECLICGWKTKLKGFAISHVVRSHDVERPYGCQQCSRSFFLPSRLQQHVRAAHRPGRYACPFCCFRSHFLGGFRRHCSRCNAREEEDEGGARGGGGGAGGGGAAAGEEEENEEEEEEVKKERRGARKRRRTERAMADEEEEDEEDE